MEVASETENFSSLVEFKHYSMADKIQKENEQDKINVKVPVKPKKDFKHGA